MANSGQVDISEEDFLQLSGIQHFAFCKRQWALIHIEQLWKENLRTVEGSLLHERTHDPFFTEKRKNVIVSRDMPIFSRSLGITGKCDVVEFVRDDEQGVKLFGRAGKWLPHPVEYKRGKTKLDDCDRLQLTAQAMCLEEMLVCPMIEQGFLFYGETRRREKVNLTEELRDSVRKMLAEMHEFFGRRYTPRVKRSKSCNACSLKNDCLPRLQGSRPNVASYIGETAVYSK